MTGTTLSESERKGRIEAVGDVEHARERHHALQHRRESDDHRADSPRRVVDLVHERSGLRAFVEARRESMHVPEQVTSKVEHHPLVESRGDVLVEDGDPVCEHGQHQPAGHERDQQRRLIQRTQEARQQRWQWLVAEHRVDEDRERPRREQAERRPRGRPSRATPRPGASTAGRSGAPAGGGAPRSATVAAPAWRAVPGQAGRRVRATRATLSSTRTGLPFRGLRAFVVPNANGLQLGPGCRPAGGGPAHRRQGAVATARPHSQWRSRRALPRSRRERSSRRTGRASSATTSAGAMTSETSSFAPREMCGQARQRTSWRPPPVLLDGDEQPGGAERPRPTVRDPSGRYGPPRATRVRRPACDAFRSARRGRWALRQVSYQRSRRRGGELRRPRCRRVATATGRATSRPLQSGAAAAGRAGTPVIARSARLAAAASRRAAEGQRAIRPGQHGDRGAGRATTRGARPPTEERRQMTSERPSRRRAPAITRYHSGVSDEAERARGELFARGWKAPVPQVPW